MVNVVGAKFAMCAPYACFSMPLMVLVAGRSSTG